MTLPWLPFRLETACVHPTMALVDVCLLRMLLLILL
jgi:hypothetical protein